MTKKIRYETSSSKMRMKVTRKLKKKLLKESS